jgi:hypothetical protein
MAIGASFAERGSNSAISARYSRTKGRLVRILDCDDRSDAAYPILAGVRAARRDNLRDTIAALEKRLANLAVVSVPELA